MRRSSLVQLAVERRVGRHEQHVDLLVRHAAVAGEEVVPLAGLLDGLAYGDWITHRGAIIAPAGAAGQGASPTVGVRPARASGGGLRRPCRLAGEAVAG